ncbi:sensor histidine kinase [Microtetraspora niveoalba]|uniref:sensor histidine kinase n=1 Tax=Microtetraspora niveoalba TaxID=46175 RepID=UPI0008329347|nr:sensor histidine kinase [Microtetraspora niveoalba]
MSWVRDIGRRRADLAAVVVGLALFGFGLAEIYVPLAPYVDGEGPDLTALSGWWVAVLTVLLAGYCLAVAACRSYPRAAVVLAGVCFIAQSFTPVLPEWPVVPLLALVGVCFGCVALAGRYGPEIAGVSYFVSLGIETTIAGDPDWAFIVFVALAVMGPAYAVRMRRAQAARLVASAAEREATARLDERLRIARELHDIVSHGVTVMVLQAGAAQVVLESDTRQAHESLDAVQSVGRDVVTELRRLLVILRGAEGGPERLPSLRHLDPLLAGVRAACGRVDVTVNGDLGTVPAAIDVSGYRVLQEALTNVVKHAPGATVSVSIDVGRTDLRIRVVDDGPGIGQRSDSGGHGLTGISERVELFGGTATAGPEDGGGFEVRVELPLSAKAAAPVLSETGAPA